MISARFFLVRLTIASSTASAELQAVTRGADNASWSKATPTGKLLLNSLTDAEVDWFLAQRRNRKGNGYGVEFDITAGRGERPPHTVGRDGLRVAEVGRDAGMVDGELVFQDAGRVKLQGSGGGWCEWEMQITNPDAYLPLLESFHRGDGDWWLTLR